MKHMTEVTERLMNISLSRLLLISIVASVMLTLPFVSGMSILLRGRITRDYLITGSVTALIVSLIVSYFLLLLIDQIRKSEERFRLLFESATDAIFVLDERGNFIDVNSAAYSRLGYAKEEMLSMHISRLEAPEFAAMAPERFQQLAQYGQTVFESAHVRKDGAIMPVEINTKLVLMGGEKRIFSIIRDITERKRAEDSLRESEVRTRSIIESLPAGMQMYRLEPDGRLIFTGANPAADRILGVDNRTFIGKTIEEAFPPIKATEIPQRYREVAASGKAWYTEQVNYHDNAIQGVFEVHAFQTTSNNMAVVFEEITARKQAEENLRESEERYRQLFDAESDAIFLIDNETGRILMANNAAVALYGYTREELLEKNNLDLSAEPSETRRVTEETPIVKENAVTIPLRYHQKKDGTVFPVEITGRFFNYQGRAVHIAAIRDITERKRAEEEISERGALLQQILDTSSVAIFLVDKAGRITQANRRMAEMFGRAMEELVGCEYVELVHPSEREAGRKKMLALLASEIQSVDLERHYWRKEGTEFWGHLAGRRFHDVHGNELGLIGVISDVTERKKAEEELREKEAKYRTLFEAANDGIFIQDETGFTDCNRKGAEMHGLPKENIIGRSPIEFAPERQSDGRLSSEVAGEKIHAALNGIPQVFEWQAMRADGTSLDVEVTLSRLEMGGKMCLQAIVRDIAARKQLEEERLRAQKLESIGTLAGGIAHDFNNLLQGIFGYISMAKLTIDQRDRSLSMLEQAEKALHQSVNLTSQLLTFSKGGKPVKKVTDLRPVIESAAKFALSGSRANHTISFADDLRAVEADEGQVMQVVQNIVLNADQAMPEGGTIVITARNTAVPGPGGPAGLPAGDYVSVAIRDSGVGIPERYLTKIFDPYFSTKEKGSGLGLATSYSIIKNHDGMIDITSVPGKGSTFTVYLPAARAAQEQAVSPAPKGCAVGRTCRVLVMDDEHMIRVVAGDLLRELGHEAEFAEHGDAAIELYKRAKMEGRPFDLVILDLTIRGGMGGEGTLRELLKIDPGVKAVVSSGYSDDEVIATYRQHGFSSFLKKPYNMGELARVLHDVMA